MKRPTAQRGRATTLLTRCGVLALASVPLGGCLAYKAVTMPVKLAATTAVVAGETAGAVVTSTGKLATSAVRATGNVGSDAIDSAARLAQAGTITFVDSGSGAVVRVPWREGATLAGASSAARIDLIRKAVQIVRAGRVVFAAKRLVEATQALDSGDVVRIGDPAR